MGSISKPFFRFPLSEGPEAGGQPRTTQEPTPSPAQVAPVCVPPAPLPSRWEGRALGPFTSPWTTCSRPVCPTASPNASCTSQVAVSKDTQEGQGIAVNPVEGIRWVQALEQVSNVAHVDTGLSHRVWLCREGDGQGVTRAKTHPAERSRPWHYQGWS